ncbi:hypothetical protein PoB_007223600 [Plakobranchus ocellatus]|uniref:Uncharacterized protein n=1 Tax=Plakobranchus ocellatus TaxID=259542 RepID=A0AAV4DP93_9GAST|nr:hypothetical protein PoB_007223600 [Plakobranchus ocellatus]
MSRPPKVGRTFKSLCPSPPLGSPAANGGIKKRIKGNFSKNASDVMRRGKLKHLVTTGKFEGKRSRGRQREKIMDGLATWLGTGKVLDTLAAVKDRDLWRDMIANAYKQGT